MTIAGFQSPDEGRILFGDEDITDLPAERRGIGLVFQGYAIFPHMTIRDNIAYPLRARRMKRPVIDRMVRDMAALMEIEDLLDRRPDEISGGQRQRVAIARALVFQPRLLLLDEPLSALDRSLRDRMKAELRRVHRQLGVTIIMVTHDQDEACELADRILLMKQGTVIADGNPRDLYLAPPTREVATFFGRANFLAVTRDKEGRLSAGGAIISGALASDDHGHLLVRPEDFQLGCDGGLAQFDVLVEDAVFRSGRFGLTGTLPTGERIEAELRDGDGQSVRPGDWIALSVIRARAIG